MTKNDTNSDSEQAIRGLVRRLIEHLLAGIIGFVFSFPIALLVCAILCFSGLSWSFIGIVFIAIIGGCATITAIWPSVGGEVIIFVSKYFKGHLEFICKIFDSITFP